MEHKDHKELFNTSEFLSWSQAAGLLPEERYLFNKYILPRERTDKILEIGTGNGRLLFSLSNQGFSKSTGIDLSARLISVAKQRGWQGTSPIDFLLMDAVKLGFKDQQFNLILALQQIMSLIPIKEHRLEALKECHRALIPGGLLLLSLLHFPGRWYNKIVSSIALPVKIFRREFYFINYRYVPWLQLGGKINLKYFLEKQPYLYWTTAAEILETLKGVGFQVVNYVTSRMIRENLTDFVNGGHLYVAAIRS